MYFKIVYIYIYIYIYIYKGFVIKLPTMVDMPNQTKLNTRIWPYDFYSVLPNLDIWWAYDPFLLGALLIPT